MTSTGYVGKSQTSKRPLNRWGSSRFALSPMPFILSPLISAPCPLLYALCAMRLTCYAKSWNHKPHYLPRLGWLGPFNPRAVFFSFVILCPLHIQKAYSNSNNSAGQFPVAEKVASEIVSLPMYPGLSHDQQKQVVAKIKQFLTKWLDSLLYALYAMLFFLCPFRFAPCLPREIHGSDSLPS